MKVQGKRKTFAVSDMTSVRSSYVEVVFGAPSKACKGYGICKLEAISQSRHSYRINMRIENRAVGKIILRSPEVISFEFALSSISADTLLKQFKMGKFFLSERLMVRSRIFMPMDDLQTYLYVQPGLYPLNYLNEIIRIDFPIE